MRHRRGWAALAAVALLGGCAQAPQPQPVGAVRGRPVAERAGVVDCATTYLVIATVSRCGSGGLKMGVAAD